MDINRIFKYGLPRLFHACAEVDKITESIEPHSNAIDVVDERSAYLRASAMFQEMALAAKLLADRVDEMQGKDQYVCIVDSLHLIYASAGSKDSYLQDRFAAEDALDLLMRRVRKLAEAEIASGHQTKPHSQL
jgi:hypothetical protein